MACLIAAAGVAYANYDLVYDFVLGFNYEPSAELATIINHIDLTGEGDRILRASRPELQAAADFNKNCPTVNAQTSTLGCYYAKRIYVYDIDSEELDGIKEAVLAHELLHAVWERSSAREKQELEPLLLQIFEDNKAALAGHMENYESEDYIDELHSIIGTQLESAKLGSVLREHYARYFNQLDAVVAYFQAYDAILTGQRQEAEALYAQIQAKKTEIDQRTSAYEQSYTQLSADIDNYNVRAGRGWSTYAERDALNSERNRLLSRQQLLNQEYQALSALIDETNQIVAKYNQLVEHLGRLQESIDSNAKQLPSASEL